MKDVKDFLKEAGVTPTPVRILVYKCLSQTDMPLSLGDLESLLESVDKSTVSRTLSTFRDHHLIHSFNDGSGSVKYEICRSHNHDHHNDLHVHFRCEKCGMTICLPDVKIPDVDLPSGFVMHEANYVVSGICVDCLK